jgi:hypothetical protein
MLKRLFQSVPSRERKEYPGFPGVYVGMTKVGRGVFAARDFATGEKVLTFIGPEVDEETGRELSDTVQIGRNRLSNRYNILRADFRS